MKQAYLPVFDTDMPKYDGLQHLALQKEEYGQPAEKYWGFSMFQWLGIGAFLLFAIIYSCYISFGQREEDNERGDRRKSTEKVKSMAARDIAELDENAVKESLV